MFAKKAFLALSSVFALLNFSFFSCVQDDFSTVCDLTIKYYYNYEDADGVKRVSSRDILMRVPKGSRLSGSPLSWDSRWENHKESIIQFGYEGDGRTGISGEKYIYESEDGVWKFNTIVGEELGIPGLEWDTSMTVNTSLSLIPKYEKESGEEDFVIYFSYKKPDATQQKGYRDVLEKRTLSKKAVSQGSINLKDIDDLEIYNIDKASAPEYVYGYKDLVDHNRLFLHDEDDNGGMKYVTYNKQGLVENTYNSNSTVLSLDMENITLCIPYVPMGYENIPADEEADGGIFGVEQVFIPGNIDKDGVQHPFPYTRLGSNATEILQQYPGGSAIYKDCSEVKLVVPDFYMFAEVTPFKIYQHIRDNYSDVLSKYNFSSGSNSFRSLENPYVTFTCMNIFDAMVFCNMLTEYYNTIHPDKPLTYAYFATASATTDFPSTPDYSYVRRLTNANAFYNFINMRGSTSQAMVYENEYADGFRLPYDYMWEYAARIVTDERQLPNDDIVFRNELNISPGESPLYKPVLSPNEQNGYMYPFQSVKSYFDQNGSGGSDYIGSGAGLASWDGVKYNKRVPRTTLSAVGRSSKTAREPEVGVDLIKTDSTGAVNLNRKNGAGLWGMSGTFYQWCYTATLNSEGGSFTSSDLRFSFRGGAYDHYNSNLSVGYQSSYRLHSWTTSCRPCRIVR